MPITRRMCVRALLTAERGGNSLFLLHVLYLWERALQKTTEECWALSLANFNNGLENGSGYYGSPL